MSTTALDNFLDVLEKSRLLAAAHMGQLREQVATRPDVKPASLARWLVDRNLLTRWQGEELLGGRKLFFLDKYKLLEKVGAGASGTVYKAEQTGMGRIVALKVLPEDLAQKSDALARFRQESRAAAAVHHAHIITTYDCVQDGDTHFLVMEYLEGKDLNAWIKGESNLPINWCCECIRQAALGLQHAHQLGLVHRDIKPGNILIACPDSKSLPIVKVLDMGFAKMTNNQGGVRLTQAWQIFGTPDYMSPEQAESTADADIRSDIFSLGVTLFKLLTGQLPFAGATPVQKLLARANRDAPLVSSLRPDIPLALDAVVAKMLARIPANRFQLPSDVAAALTPFSMATGAVASHTGSGGQSSQARAVDAGSTDSPTDHSVDLAGPQSMDAVESDFDEPGRVGANVEASGISAINSGPSMINLQMQPGMAALRKSTPAVAPQAAARPAPIADVKPVESAPKKQEPAPKKQEPAPRPVQQAVANQAQTLPLVVRIKLLRGAVAFGMLIGGVIGMAVGGVIGFLIAVPLKEVLGRDGATVALFGSMILGISLGAIYQGIVQAVTQILPPDPPAN